MLRRIKAILDRERTKAEKVLGVLQAGEPPGDDQAEALLRRIKELVERHGKGAHGPEAVLRLTPDAERRSGTSTKTP